MLPFHIKICGITRAEDGVDAVRFGADAIGLNFYNKSPRFVDPVLAQTIIDSINGEKNDAIREPTCSSNGNQIRQRSVQMIGVFVDEEVNTMLDMVQIVRLDAIQLHGNEEPAIVRELKDILDRRQIECKLIRAIRSNPAKADELEDQTKPLQSEIRQWTESGIDAILLDAAAPGLFGGSGMVLDWNVVANLSPAVPVILAGGLTPDNVGQAVEVARVHCVDVASGVESAPGIKDPEKMQAFIGNARRALRQR